MPATVLPERVRWTGSIRWFRDNVNRLRDSEPGIGRGQWKHPTIRGMSLLIHRSGDGLVRPRACGVSETIRVSPRRTPGPS